MHETEGPKAPDIVAFQKLCDEVYRTPVSYEEAKETYCRMTRLYRLLAKPLPPCEEHGVRELEKCYAVATDIRE